MIESVKWEGEESKKWHKLSGDKSMIEQIFFFRIFNKISTQAHKESSHTSTHKKKERGKDLMSSVGLQIDDDKTNCNKVESNSSLLIWELACAGVQHDSYTHKARCKRKKLRERKTINLWSERCRPSSGEPPVHLNSWWKLNNVYFMSTKKLFSSSVEFHPSYPVSCVCAWRRGTADHHDELAEV